MIRIGIFFGGPSREREISFAGGRTAFEHLDKAIFEPVPIFVDSFGRFVKLQSEWMYADGIRNFYPVSSLTRELFRLYIESYPELKSQPLSAGIGTLIDPSQFGDLFDFAFLAMHGPDCEDGAIQGLLEWYRIPYSGPGMLGSSIGINKILQNRMLTLVNGQQKNSVTISFADWNDKTRKEAIFRDVRASPGIPLVIKAPHQGSSIGVSIVKEDNFDTFEKAVDQCFFIRKISASDWGQLDQVERRGLVQRIANLDEGIGYPLYLDHTLIAHPEALIAALDEGFGKGVPELTLISSHSENEVLCEEFITGQEFSCGCIQTDDGTFIALPPTEILKSEEVFDFNSKYRAGGTRKRIPVDTSFDNNLKIQQTVSQAAQELSLSVCVRIDGFLTPDGQVLLHDPNTIPGMSPTSLIFKQMAEIGLNVTQALTYFIRQSVYERISTGKNTTSLRNLLDRLDTLILGRVSARLPVKALLISSSDNEYSQAKQWYGRLSAEGKFRPEVYLRTTRGSFALLPLPLLFKDTIGDLLPRLESEPDPLIEATRRRCAGITRKYAGEISFSVIFHNNTDSFSKYLEPTGA